ncbi:MAG: IS1 family transposase, partial [Prevotellaceae bacterium]|nr:IS1 family transposase [Prevotellaceae bacterium]
MSIQCPHCQSKNLVKQGFTGNGTQKWQCNSC